LYLLWLSSHLENRLFFSPLLCFGCFCKWPVFVACTVLFFLILSFVWIRLLENFCKNKKVTQTKLLPDLDRKENEEKIERFAKLQRISASPKPQNQSNLITNHDRTGLFHAQILNTHEPNYANRKRQSFMKYPSFSRDQTTTLTYEMSSLLPVLGYAPKS